MEMVGRRLLENSPNSILGPSLGISDESLRPDGSGFVDEPVAQMGGSHMQNADQVAGKLCRNVTRSALRRGRGRLPPSRQQRGELRSSLAPRSGPSRAG